MNAQSRQQFSVYRFPCYGAEVGAHFVSVRENPRKKNLRESVRGEANRRQSKLLEQPALLHLDDLGYPFRLVNHLYHFSSHPIPGV